MKKLLVVLVLLLATLAYAGSVVEILDLWDFNGSVVEILD